VHESQDLSENGFLFEECITAWISSHILSSNSVSKSFIMFAWKRESFTCMVVGLPLLVLVYAIHKAWQLCPGPIHQTKAFFLKSINQKNFKIHWRSWYVHICMLAVITNMLSLTPCTKHEVQDSTVKPLTIIPSNCHEISLTHQSHHMPISWAWSWALNNHSTWN
jgi:hypothetical protein